MISSPDGDINVGGYRVTALGNATEGTDALNRDTGDSRYYLSSTTLNNITAPTNNLSLNN